MAKKALRHGYSTGACAAAAAYGAVRALFGQFPEEAALFLPFGKDEAQKVSFKLVNPLSGEGWRECGVVKEGGDDHPDVTHGIEIRARASFSTAKGEEESLGIEISAGEGVGTVTKPGLAVKVGQPAINPAPREMIREAVLRAAAECGVSVGIFSVMVSVPEGAARAKKTMNAQLGIIGGISILGTTGIVIPMSTAAWRATIDACLDVALATGHKRAILAFGRTSEEAAKRLYPELADTAAVIMGDHVGYSLQKARERGLSPVLAGQFAKFVKVAGKNFSTHVKDSSLDLKVVKRLMEKGGFPKEEAEAALSCNTARQVFEELSQKGERGFWKLLAREVAEVSCEEMGGNPGLEAVLFDYSGGLLARWRCPEGEG